MIGGLFFSDADCCPLDFFDFFCDDDDIFSVVARSITDTDYSLALCLSLPLSLFWNGRWRSWSSAIATSTAVATS